MKSRFIDQRKTSKSLAFNILGAKRLKKVFYPKYGCIANIALKQTERSAMMTLKIAYMNNVSTGYRILNTIQKDC